jgi:hypothetical protein
MVGLPNREVGINSDLPAGILFKEKFKKVIGWDLRSVSE